MRARALPIYVIIVSALMLGPLVVVIGSSFSDSELTRFPPEGLSLRWFRTVLKRSDWIDAFTTSVRIAVITALSALALGVSAALGLVRGRMRWRGAVNAIFLGPVLFPTIVIGIALLQWLVLLGVTRSIWSIVLGHIVITMPFIIRFVMINLQSSGVLLEQAARSLGANGWTAFWRVTLPNMRSALVGGATLAFIISMYRRLGGDLRRLGSGPHSPHQAVRAHRSKLGPPGRSRGDHRAGHNRSGDAGAAADPGIETRIRPPKIRKKQVNPTRGSKW